MSQSKNITTNYYKLTNVENFIDSIIRTDEPDSYYVFAGGHIDFANSAISNPNDDVYDTTIDPYRSMIFGKKISANNVMPVIPRYNYVAGTTYAPYDDSDPLILTKKFYTCVRSSSYIHVFKCIDNHLNSPSTVPPNFSDTDATDYSYQTSDGYKWRYMYSVATSAVSAFGTANYIPYVANASVSNNAIPGAIDNIKVIQSGNGYSNYFGGTFSVSDIIINGNTYLYTLANTASNYSTFYNGCIIYITSDPSGNSAGQFRTIDSYVVNSTAKVIKINSPFTAVPRNGAQYLIFPGVKIQGDATESEQALAWAVVNNSTNTIDRVDMLNRGKDYKYATATVLYSNVVNVTTPASLRTIYSPPGGHGANVLAELGCRNVSVAMSFTNDENGTIPSTNRYQKIGLLKNPVFANVALHLANQTGSFVQNEIVYKVDLVELKANGTSVGTARINAPDADFKNQFNKNDWIYLTDDNTYQLSQVFNITNSTSLLMTANSNIVSGNLSIYKTDVSCNGIITASSPNLIFVSNVYSSYTVNDLVIGSVSGAQGYISQIERNDVSKDFSTFIQCFKYIGAITTGTFVENEKIQQIELGVVNASADLFSATVNGSYLTMLTSNQIGVFNASRIVGNTSGAAGVITAAYSPELVFGSGSIIYLENMDKIYRKKTQKESFKFILNF